MPANEFEKQVQQQMDDFQLNPSASVWKKVEEQIRKKKRRRIIFFFILPAAIGLLGYSIYRFMNNDRYAEPVKQQVVVENEKQQSTNNKETTTSDKGNTIPNQQENKTDLPTTNKVTGNKKTLAVQRDDIQVSIDNPVTAIVKRNTEGKKSNKSNPVKARQDDALVINSDFPASQKNVKPADKQKGKINDEITTTIVSEVKNSNADITTDTKNTISEKEDSVKTDAVSKADNINPPAPEKKTSKPVLKWGIDFSAGIASIQNKVFSLNKSNDGRMLYNSPTGSSTGSQAGTTNPPSSIRPGLAFRIGVLGELQLSERSKVSAGLQYVYASNSIKTGTGIDSTLQLTAINNSYSVQVDRVYRGTQRNNYTNNYHFVSIPLSWHWQINKSKKLPLQWNIGVSFSYLVATNALVYSSSYGGIYYKDKDAINKTHFNIGTGLSFRLKGKKGMEWVLGPEISFDTRKLVNNGYDQKQYLLFGGVNTKLFFPKKKNK